MTAAGTTPDAWKEVLLIGIIPDGGTEIAFASLVEDVSALDWMEKDMEGKILVNGGRIAQFNMTGEEGITMKVYPVDALLDNSNIAQGVVQMFHPQTTEDATQPVLVDNTRTRTKHGIILLQAETLPATAGALPAESKTAYRVQIINAYMTSYKPSYDGKIWSAEVTFKWTPFQKDATSNKREESTDGSVQLPAAITSATSF